MEKFNSSIPLRYGIIAFTATLTVGLLMYVFYHSVVSSFMMFAAIGLFSIALVLFLGIWSGITYRRENGGVISFGHAFLAVFIVFLFNSLGSISAQLLINKVIDKQYAEKASSMLKEKMSDRFEKMNMTDDQIKEATKDINAESFDPPIAKQFKSFTIFLAVSLAVAAIIAAFIKRGSADIIPSDSPPDPIRTI
jgi:hypothetical protein